MDNKNFKAAFTTDDSIIITPHFGRANYFEVIEVSDGTITSRERRDKLSFHKNHDESNLPDHNDRHQAIYDAIKDCDFVVSRNMGYGIYDFLLENTKQPIITDIIKIDDALSQIINGTIENKIDKLH